MPSKQSTRKKSNLQLVSQETQIDWQRIEQFARQSVAVCQLEQQTALILLLDEISNSTQAASIALCARNAAFGNADALIDDAVKHTLAPMRARRAS